jgi:hypothetical protein
MVREFYGRTSLIWSFESLAQRVSLRSKVFSTGVWARSAERKTSSRQSLSSRCQSYFDR